MSEYRYRYSATIDRVIDGDTVVARIDLGFDVHILRKLRLASINAPEMREEGGRESRDFLKHMLDNALEIEVRTFKDRTGKYGRYLANLFVLPRDGPMYCVNKVLVSAGHAKIQE